MRLTVSIVTYNNSFTDLKRVIESVLNSVEVNVKLIIVDNSENREIKELCIDSRIDYIHNPSNPGFGSAHNLGIIEAKKYKSEYHLILNPDIHFSDSVLIELLKFMESDQSIGLLMPKVLYPDGQTQYLCKLLPTPKDLFIRRFIPFKKIREKINEKYELRESGYNKIMDIPYLSGCFLLTRTKILDKFKGFDERFFMYLEDTDLSRRIHSKYRTVFYPYTHVFHNFEKGSYYNNKLLKFHIISAIKYFNKWGWLVDKERELINKKTLENIL